jgi:hypothetical protein
VQRAELELFDRALGLLQCPGDSVNAQPIDEALDDHAALVGGQLIDQAEQPCALVGEHQIRRRDPGAGRASELTTLRAARPIDR